MAFMKGHKINLGRKQSESAKEKLRQAHLGKSSWNKGKHLSTEHKVKLSLAKMGDKNSSKKPEVRVKMSKSHLGEKNGSWKGGISKLPYSIDWTDTLKRAIRQKFKYTCQLCFNEGLIVHHIDYDKKNCDSSNLIVLCRPCHNKTNINRKYWTDYFMAFLKKLA